ncbi:GH39 family glycosyl hydrolase [Saccharococcus caldoxylosilyticus]|uniref:Beta-xylosidase n=1 Tax=Parageobacillus caldoxylosilyticus NBRC 107762 TaxID=1220594 RepID=A0A023DFC6_9BACL|nr:xylan 1,4-beta-xylosidase [Parageobacillus caldoxylosilyticus]MBB3853299.1 xylan 1,4-beta-xylosidase [Parageobacillus caldoxylosilyticus]BDG43638.1 beta-xylosidase [Parageobacillus caldoxylosilyticus]GAJ39952.1 beta-xylosidase [Parageobacillus caldoxylosilyticus NBRC 107762]
MKKIKVRDDEPKLFKKNWKFCVGTGRLGLALQKEYLDHLKLVQEKIGFQYIRGHGLLSDDVGIYREVEIDGETKPFYNFTYIDRIIDSYLDLGIRPFVELGFMPSALASGDQTVFYWKGNVTPPKDYNKWYDLIVAVVSHFVERYGIEEVLRWPFEVWNEPNLVNFWKDADKQEYFKLYKVTAAAVKSVHPDIQVGGPAICGGSHEWIVDFLNFCADENVPVDFVSRHAYTSKAPHKKTFEYYYQELEAPEDMLQQFKTVRELIDQSPFPHLPFHITEYNTSYSPINPVHDTVLNAAYIARILSEGGDYVDSFSYWTFSDVFEEMDVPKAQFHGGFGLVALNSIPKPTFYLFTFFNALGNERLYRDEEIIVTRREDGSIAMVAWNLVMEKGNDFTKDLEIEIPIPFEDVFVKRQTVDEDNGNPWAVWKQMGRPRFPNKKAVETLRQVAQPKVTTCRMRTENNILRLQVRLTKNEVTLIEVEPVKDETYTYVGLDDSFITSYS